VRFATLVEDGQLRAAAVRDARLLPLALPDPRLASLREIAGSGAEGMARVTAWVEAQPSSAWRALDDRRLGPAMPDPGAIYTIGLNYRGPDEEAGRPDRPLVYAKLPTSVSGDGATLSWDRTLTPNVDPEVELGVVIGEAAMAVSPEEAMRHVFGYACMNDVSSRDPWLDGDQWLLGKSFAGFCPVGPWIATRDEIDPTDLRLGCTLNGEPIQEGSTRQMRFSIPELISYLSRHVALRPGDLIATGTPGRLHVPPGPDRHLEPGDVVAVWIEHLGELTTTVV